MWRSQNVHILVQTNDVYFAVTMLTLYVADIQTNNQTVQPYHSMDPTHSRQKHIHIREPKKRKLTSMSVGHG